MTALEFRATINADGTVNVPENIAARVAVGSPIRVILLVPTDTEEARQEDEAWDRLGEEQFFRGYADSDSIYDDV
jgi:hypothetical protein